MPLGHGIKPAIHGIVEARIDLMKNIHLPLPERLRRARHDQIAAYATEMAGTDFDLDPDLEAAGIDRLVKTG